MPKNTALWIIFGLLTPAFLLLPPDARAQRIKSTLTGIVTDASGSTIPNAKVELVNEGTNLGSNFVTAANGSFTFPFLDAGTYTVRTSMPGFKSLIRTGIVLRVASDLQLDLQLEVGETVEKVEVSGKASLLESVSSTLGQVIDNTKISDLPLNGRNIFSLLNIIPGSSLGGPGATPTNPSINGQRQRGNNFTIDGVTANQEYAGFTTGAGVANTPMTDAIAEFKVVTSNYSAEYGRAMGGVISLSIKSGTNQFHGAAFEFLRNDKLNARNFFAAPAAQKPVLRFNQFGGAVGGPIKKDKLFFFTDGEWTRNRSTAVSVQTVPTLAMRSGDFSGDANAIYDPATTRVTNGVVTRTVFPGNTIPSTRIDASAKLINDYWPAPTSGGLVSNYLSVSSTGANVFRHDTKMDYRINSTNAISGRFSYNDNEQIGAHTFPGPANPNLTAYQHIKSPGFQVNYTRTFSPTVLNEFRVGWQRNRMAVAGEQSSYDDWRTKLGLPQIFSQKELQYGFPNIAPTGVGAIGQSVAQFLFFQNTTEFNDTLSWTKGKHFIKIGASLTKIHSQDYIPSSPAGVYNFSGQFTTLPGVAASGRGFADYLLGLSNSASATLVVGGGVQPRNTEFSVFVQDDFRIARRLTLNIGVRYDFATAIRTDEGTLWGFDPKTNTMQRAEPPSDSDKNNVAPRFGFAWEAMPKTVVRGGYGISSFPQYKGLAGFFGGPPPQQGHSFVATDTVTPGLTFRDTFGVYDEALKQTFVVTAANNVPAFNTGNLRSPYVQSWNLTVERQLSDSLMVAASYVGNKGTHLENIHQANQLPSSLLGPDSLFGGRTAQQRRPYPNAGLVQTMQNDTNGNYNSLQLKSEWHNSKGLTFLVSYTYGKALDTNRADNQDNYNNRGSYGPPRSDLRQAFVTSYGYELPFGAGKHWLNHRGVMNQIVGGWQTNGILTARSGFPIRLIAASNLSGSFSLYQRPDRLGNGALSASQRTLDRWFDVSAFAVPQAYTFGTAGNNFLTAPGLFNLDFSLFKGFRITEGTRLEFRAEAFNLSNTPGFGTPNGTIGSTLAGKITTTSNDNRSLQFALKFLF